ncbi:MAG: VanZ family protein [Calditrichaeota bacterium]|nr:VanZ family protein [Calditrichota bacterium]
MFDIPGFDLILHFIEYGILAYLIMMYFEVSQKRLSIFNRALITVIFCGVIGGLNELWQTRIPGRTFELADEIVNVLGALVVVLTYRLRQLYRFSKNNSQ